MTRVITIDWETYWDSKSGYSVAKMGPVAYIRDPRFAVLCLGFRLERGGTQVVPAAAVPDTLKRLELDRADTIVVGHNIAGFDALILSEKYGVRPRFIVDTITLMHWLGLSRVMSYTHKTLTEALGHGIKRPGTETSDGKRTQDEFTFAEWASFTQYCADDVTQCSNNFFSMLPLVKSPDVLQLCSLTARMATEPAIIPDGQMLDQFAEELRVRREQVLQGLARKFGCATTDEMLKRLRSRLEFPKMLESLGCPCPTKTSPTTGETVYATAKTDTAFTDLRMHPDPDVVALVEAKLSVNSSILQTRTDRLRGKLLRDRPVPIILAAYKAHTGRYAAGGNETTDGLNFQNLNKRNPDALALRRALRVPDGYALVACDSSQVEARMLAYEACQNDLLRQFAEGRDPYSEMASKIFNRDAGEIHDGAKQGNHAEHDTLKMYRNVGKTCILSAGYGVGAGKFAHTLLISGARLADDTEQHNVAAKRALMIYRNTNSYITAFWKTCQQIINDLYNNQAMGDHFTFGGPQNNLFTSGRGMILGYNTPVPYIRLPNGYHLWYPGLRTDETGQELIYDRPGAVKPPRVYGGSICENVTQALAFHMLAWQACRMKDPTPEWPDGLPVACNIHDAWSCVVPEDRAEACKARMEQCMSAVPDWLPDFPVSCEAEIGHDFTIA